MGTAIEPPRSVFSILRWRTDTTRDEARNVAVILVDDAGRSGGVRSAPLSTISPRLQEQGFLDSMLVGLEQRFAQTAKPTAQELRDMHGSMQRSLYLTDPRPVAAPDPEATLQLLFKTYVAPRGYGRRGFSKGAILDRTVGVLRRRGLEVVRGQYVGDFIFDAVVRRLQPQVSVIDVLTFAANVKDWSRTERDAGHFLYALEHLGDVKGLAVIQAPNPDGPAEARRSFRRVLGWLRDANVPHVAPDDVVTAQQPAQLVLDAIG